MDLLSLGYKQLHGVIPLFAEAVFEGFWAQGVSSITGWEELLYDNGEGVWRESLIEPKALSLLSLVNLVSVTTQAYTYQSDVGSSRSAWGDENLILNLYVGGANCVEGVVNVASGSNSIRLTVFLHSNSSSCGGDAPEIDADEHSCTAALRPTCSTCHTATQAIYITSSLMHYFADLTTQMVSSVPNRLTELFIQRAPFLTIHR